MDKDKIIEELRKQNQQLQQKIEEQAETIKLLSARIFGKKTEKIDKNQLSLLSDDELQELDENTDTSSEEIVEVETELRVVRHRKAKPKGQRAAFLDSLEQVDVVHKLEQEACTCTDCHKKLIPIGKKCVYREVGLRKPELFCRNHYQETYKCEHCHPKGGDMIITSEVPTSPILPHSLISNDIIPVVIMNKFGLATPLNRQVQYFKSLGLPVTAKQLAHAVIKASEQVEFIHERLTKTLLDNPVIHMDEIPFKVLSEKARSTSYFWVMRTTEEFSNQKIVVFNYSSDRKQENIGELVGDYTGCIICDGYNAYSSERYPQITYGSCLVHIRRQFVEIVKTLKNGSQSNAAKAVRLLNSIFEAEKQLEYQNAKEKAQKRKLHLKKYVDKFYDFLDTILNPSGKLKKAIGYARKFRTRLEKIYEIGELPLSNNPVEQAIRPATLVRKNSLFATTVAGAKANAIWYSLIQTAKLNGLDVSKYLNYIFSLLEQRKDVDVEAYLPWNSEVKESCAVAN
ncbi:IS66 family transposase [Ligilactobacillus salivarius]